jgi:hypothetical protein
MDDMDFPHGYGWICPIHGPRRDYKGIRLELTRHSDVMLALGALKDNGAERLVCASENYITGEGQGDRRQRAKRYISH